jgi:hypothetical protein
MMFHPKKCANMACTCIAPEKKKFCSDHCEGIGSKMEILCLCGHADCGAATIEPGAAHEFAARPDANTPRTPPFRP